MGQTQLYFQRGAVRLYLGDCLEVMASLPDRGGFVITDPPYNAGMKYGAKTNDRQAWRDWVKWLDERRRSWERLAPEAMMFLSQTAYRHYVRHSRRGVDWDCAWFKPLSMAVCAAPYMPHWEHIAYLGKRKKGQLRHEDGTFVKHKDGGFGSDVFLANVEIGTERFGHPTPKPMRLMRDLVARCGTDAPFILDPFAGSATTLRACMDLGRPGIGIEIEERWCEAAARRLEQEPLFTVVP